MNRPCPQMDNESPFRPANFIENGGTMSAPVAYHVRIIISPSEDASLHPRIAVVEVGDGVARMHQLIAEGTILIG